MHLLLFNPSNDMALAANGESYVPPKNVRQMEDELALFPWAWADDEDVVLPANFSMGGKEQPNVWRSDGKEIDFSQCVPKPWGWSRSLRNKLLQWGVPEENMPDAAAIDEWRLWSSREFSAKYIRCFLSELERTEKENRSVFVGEEMRFCSRMEQIQCSPFHPSIFKSPWSSSGRGVFVAEEMSGRIRKRIEGVLRHQGGILIDRFYQKRMDFAMEFEAQTSGEVTFLGYSVFQAAEDGRYGGNRVASQRVLQEELQTVCGKEKMAVLASTVQLHQRLLEDAFRGRYVGPVGIDMLMCEEDGEIKIHPCVEINLRMNMGIVAIRLAQKLDELRTMVLQGMGYDECRRNQRFRFLDFLPEADFKSCILSSTRLPLSPKREHGFQASVEAGRLVITFRS